MIVLIPAAWLGLFFFFSSKNGSSARESMVLAFLGVAGFIAVATEILSLFNAVALSAVGSAWLVFTAAVCWAAWRRGRGQIITTWRARLKRALGCDGYTWALLAIVATILALTCLVALIAPPNTWDSMTYHMARVAAWQQHHSVSFYPTSIPRQNYQMPLAEFMILHVSILSGSDHMANMVQWFCFLICIVAASLLASELGASRRTSALAAVFAATIPMAVLQSSSTQNDVVLSAFILLFTYYMLKIRRAATVPTMISGGVALGAALLTKGTAFVYCPVIGLLLGLFPRHTTDQSDSRIRYLLKLSVVPVIALLLCSGHFARNYSLYGHPLSTESHGYRNESFSLPLLCSNVIRNICLHLGVPSSEVNERTYGFVETILGDELNNPASTWVGCTFAIPYVIHEDLAGNLPHALLLMLAVALFLPMAWRATHQSTKLYGLSIVLAGAAYAAVFKWQLWASRLHTPLFFLAAPFMAMVMPKDQKYGRIIAPAIAAGMFVYALPYLLLNESRPLLPIQGYSALMADRTHQTFRSARWLEPDFVRGAAIAGQIIQTQSLTDIGLYTDVDDWEYPLRRLLSEYLPGREFRFHHLGVTDISHRLQAPLPDIRLILCTRRDGPAWWGPQGYSPVFKTPFLSVLCKDAEPREP